MERYVITGGTRLHGFVEVCGAKNAVLPILAASVLSPETCVIHNVPRLQDVVLMVEVLKSLGAKVKWENKTLMVNAAVLDPTRIPEEVMKKMRASNLVIGPLLSRFHYARVPFPGGCAIGSRPMDYHIKGLRQLGAEVDERYGYIEARALTLTGGEVYFDFPSVGATENIMAAAILAEGVTVIRNAAKEPEIIEEQNFYNRLGARIRGAGTDMIRIEGVKALRSVPIDYTVIPDRIEAGTFMLAAAIAKGEVCLKEIIPEHLESLTAKLKEAGVEVQAKEESIKVKAGKRLRAVDVTVLPYPGFPTDLQPQMTAALSLAEGTSLLTENVFSGRFRYVDELVRMGANIRVEGRSAVVKGVPCFTGAAVVAPDLRAAAAMVLAGLAAKGKTIVEGVDLLDRGYERFEEKLSSLGARIARTRA